MDIVQIENQYFAECFTSFTDTLNLNLLTLPISCAIRSFMSDDEQTHQPDAAAIIRTIKLILKSSDASYKTVNFCIEWLDQSLLEMAKIKDKGNGMAQGCPKTAEEAANDLERERAG